MCPDKCQYRCWIYAVIAPIIAHYENILSAKEDFDKVKDTFMDNLSTNRREVQNFLGG